MNGRSRIECLEELRLSGGSWEAWCVLVFSSECSVVRRIFLYGGRRSRTQPALYRPPTRASGDFGEFTGQKGSDAPRLKQKFSMYAAPHGKKIKQQSQLTKWFIFLFAAACRSVGRPLTDRGRGSTIQILPARAMSKNVPATVLACAAVVVVGTPQM